MLERLLEERLENWGDQLHEDVVKDCFRSLFVYCCYYIVYQFTTNLWVIGIWDAIFSVKDSLISNFEHVIC